MEQQSHHRSPCILLVDGDQGSRAALEIFFQRVGWSFDCVENGNSALEASARRDYDVVIADLVAFGQDSTEFLRILRERRPSQAVLMITRKGEFQKAQELLGEGAVGCLERPLDVQSLEDSVNQLISEISSAHDSGMYPQTPAVASIAVTECFTSRELAEQEFHFPVIRELYESGEIDLNLRLKLTLALQEALTNSLDHGNLELKSEWKEITAADGRDHYTNIRQERLASEPYCSRSIIVHTDYDGSRILVRITDEGKGFEVGPKSSADARNETLPPYGRGLTIMHGTLDSVSYALHGRQVTLIKQLQKTDNSGVY